MKDSKSLGRGLSSLIPQDTRKSQNQVKDTDNLSQSEDKKQNTESEEKQKSRSNTEGEFRYLAVAEIASNPYQPRKVFDEDALGELASSIAEKGVLQPLVVQEEGKGFVLIAGERRLRAAKQAGLETVPALVKSPLSEADQARLALIENLQREDLDPIERARGIADLQNRFQFTQEQVADRLHLSRSRIANTLRLLTLPESVQNALVEGKITEGHAKIIAGLPDKESQERLLQTILEHTLNVRDTESLVKTSPKAYRQPVSERVKHLASELSENLNSKVEIRPRKDRYVVTLNMSSEDELQDLAKRLQS